MNPIARVLPFLDAGVGPDPTFPDIDKATADLFLSSHLLLRHRFRSPQKKRL
jgi:hypothetical protein